MRWLLTPLLTLCACATLSGFGNSENDTQCPERVRMTAPKPAGWSFKGMKTSGLSEAVYDTPEGEQTWCQYSERVWDEQFAAIKEGREPSKVLANAERLALIQANQAEHERWMREDAPRMAAIQASNQAKVDAMAARQEHEKQQQAQFEEHQRKNEQEQRRKDVGELASILLGQANVELLASARLCSLKLQADGAQARIARERRVVGAMGGTIVQPSDEMADAAELLVTAQDAERDQRARMAKRKVAVQPCKGLVAEVASCIATNDPCSEQAHALADAWVAADMALEQRDNERERELRGKLTAEEQQKAQAHAGLRAGR